ncbi:MAG TPA: helix-turn-helix transcriptional regulator [Bradyrhizobium sp.]|uniref:helix-turn-helix transcriptional regulator n=1 Tax=Bradyrhizobium sp. TaxID=376 RepID=UPI002B8A5435|nr:helix-turn-helix transcriptional regulator [Bradyrhizobium sp.]HTA99397.1 helix-turn-helix transcriptional regulator [Bradyrhizobium sp.]
MLESESLSMAIGLIYDAALDSRLWPAALEGIRDFVGGFAANFFWQDVSKQDAGTFHCVGIEQSYLTSYFSEYAKINPLYPAAAFLDTGQVFEGDDIVPWPEMVQTRFYKEWMQPQAITGSLAVNLEKSVTAVAALAVLRCEQNGPIDLDTKRRMNLIVPHMIRGASIGQLIGQRSLERAVLTDAFNSLASAVFLVEASGRIVFSNEPALKLLTAGFVKAVGGILRFAESEANRFLRQALLSAAEQARQDTNGTAIVLNVQESRRWLAHVLPLTFEARRASGLADSTTAAVFLREAALNIPSPIENLSRSYNLTATETKILLAVVEIGGVPKIAASLGVSQQTVKTHLKKVFGKTGTKRQAELVKLMASFASSL